MSLMVLAGVVPYLVPTVVAAYRDLPDKHAIFFLNLLLGWTVIGWLAALVWACSSTSTAQPIAARGDEVAAGRIKLQGRDPRFDV